MDIKIGILNYAILDLGIRKRGGDIKVKVKIESEVKLVRVVGGLIIGLFFGGLFLLGIFNESALRWAMVGGISFAVLIVGVFMVAGEAN